MSEEEKKAIEKLNKKYKFMSENPLETYVFTTLDVHNLGIILNLIDRLQKELDKEKEYNDKLTLIFKEKLNNIVFEVETAWRKFEKLEEENE